MNTNMTYEYDRYSRHYIVRNTRILFANFTGAARQYNTEGRRNFHIVVPEDLAMEMESLGVNVHHLPPRNEDENETTTLKVSVYPDADIRLISGRTATNAVINNDNKDLDMGPLIDNEFRKGHIMNGEINIEFHIARNTKVPNSSPYLRVDVLFLPIRKSRLVEEYEAYMDDEDEDDLPM